MKLVLFAHTPPPHHGQSYMVQLLLEQFGGDARYRSAADGVQFVHVNARLSDDVQQIGRAGFRKLLRVTGFVAQALWCRLRFGAASIFYIPAPPVRAAIYRDWIVVGICRLFFRHIVYYWQAAGMSDWVERDAAGWERRLSRTLLRRPTLSIVLGEFNRRDAEWAQSRHTAVIPNAIPDPCPNYANAIEPRRRARAASRRMAFSETTTPVREAVDACEDRLTFQLLFIGLCFHEKGLFDAIEATSMANEELLRRGVRVRARLSVAGDFYSNEDRTRFDACLADPRFRDCLEYIGFVSGAAKARLFEQSDCLLFPTYYSAESFGIVLVEAMAFGLSIVTTRWRNIPEVLPPGYRAIVDPRQPAAMAAEIVKLAQAPYDASLRQYFLDNYTIEKHAERVREAIRAAIARP